MTPAISQGASTSQIDAHPHHRLPTSACRYAARLSLFASAEQRPRTVVYTDQWASFPCFRSADCSSGALTRQKHSCSMNPEPTIKRCMALAPWVSSTLQRVCSRTDSSARSPPAASSAAWLAGHAPASAARSTTARSASAFSTGAATTRRAAAKNPAVAIQFKHAAARQQWGRNTLDHQPTLDVSSNVCTGNQAAEVNLPAHRVRSNHGRSANRAAVLPRDQAERRPEWQKARVQSGSSAKVASRRSAECSSTPRSASCSSGTAANTPADASTTAAPLPHVRRLPGCS